MIPAAFITAWRSTAPWADDGASQVIACFSEYVTRWSQPVSGHELIDNLGRKLRDKEFLADMQPLLAPWVD